LGNYRTGSTVLATHLGEQYGVEYFLEPWIPIENRGSSYGPEIYGLKEKFHYFYKSGRSDFVIKFMPDQISKLTPYRELLEGDGFKIKLYRENEIESIVSNYLGTIRNKWWTTAHEEDETYTVPIKKGTISSSIMRITHNNYLLDTLDYEYDLTISYESLGFIPSSSYKKTSMPDNIEELRAAIVETYNELYR
jgi:hypothetical protein